jgi:hypothetical protein
MVSASRLREVHAKERMHFLFFCMDERHGGNLTIILLQRQISCLRGRHCGPGEGFYFQAFLK